MKKIYEILRQPKKAGDVGIEIEVEGNGLQVSDGTKYWVSHDDGSLRGMFPVTRHEYVSRDPVKLVNIKAALEELALLNKAAKPVFSFRTSVHMHINAQELTEEELCAMVYTYALLEEPLMAYCGRERKANRFCLRIQDAENTVAVIAGLMQKGVVAEILKNEGTIRYSAINLAAIRKYGSVEFRGMRGTMDVAILTHWARTLVSLREFAKGKTVTQVYNLFCNSKPSDFIRQVIPEDLVSLFTYKNYQADMLKSFSLSLELPFIYADAKKNKEKEEAKKQAKPAGDVFELPNMAVIENDWRIAARQIEDIREREAEQMDNLREALVAAPRRAARVNAPVRDFL